jgi:hypothetical protein
MKIAITGATGFIGRGLVDLLHKKGHTVIVLSRNPGRAKSLFGNRTAVLNSSGNNKEELPRELDGLDAIVNLAGENIGSFLWTKNKRKKIKESRVSTGHFISELIRLMKHPPQVLIQASAVGYYGTRVEEILAENSEHGKGFLPEITVEWEKSTAAVEASGVRYVIIRSGVVLSQTGGALPKLAMPYKLHIGTMLGSGNQWLPWIHYDDEINAIYFLITNAASNGIYNLVAPVPARMAEICKQLGPTLIRVPNSIIKLLLGRMGEETILTSERVIPEQLLREGFQFRFANVEEAIADICRKER